MDNPWRYPRYLVSILLSLPIHGAAAESLLPLPPASPAATSAPPELHPCWLEPASGTLGAPFVISQGASMAREEGSDPFQPFAKVKGGVDQGRPIKTDLFRPIQILSPSIARNYGLQPRPGEIFIANLNHRNQFYVAGIPLDAISQAIYQIQKFYKPVPILAHGQVRLKFKEPVILRSQRNKEEPTIETNDLVFSIHATGADHAYDPIIKGTDGSYALVLGVFTTETKIIENARRGFSVEQWKLNLSPQQKRAYVRRYLELSQKWGHFKPYHTRDHNCGSEMIRILDDVIGYRSEPGTEVDLAESLGQRYPSLVVPALRKRGLLGSAKDSRDPDLEKEPDPWIQSIYRTHQQEGPAQPMGSPARLGS